MLSALQKAAPSKSLSTRSCDILPKAWSMATGSMSKVMTAVYFIEELAKSNRAKQSGNCLGTWPMSQVMPSWFNPSTKGDVSRACHMKERASCCASGRRPGDAELTTSKCTLSTLCDDIPRAQASRWTLAGVQGELTTQRDSKLQADTSGGICWASCQCAK